MNEGHESFNIALHNVYFDLLQKNNIVTAKMLMAKSSIQFDLKQLEHLLSLHLAGQTTTEIKIFEDVMELFGAGVSSDGLNQIFSSIFKMLISQNVKCNDLVTFIQGQHTVSLNHSDSRLYANYLMAHRYLDEQADPDIFELFDQISKRNIDNAISIGFDKIITDRDATLTPRAIYAAEILSRCVIHFGTPEKIETVIGQIYAKLDNFQFSWQQHLEVTHRLRQLGLFQLLKQHLIRINLPLQTHKLHKSFVSEIIQFLTDVTGDDPLKHLDVLYQLNSEIMDGKHDGIPQSFHPEIIGRILIGEYASHDRSLDKVLYAMKFTYINQPYKIDSFCDYIWHNENRDIR